VLLSYQQFNAGEGTPLVVIHGLFGAADNWRTHVVRWSEERHVISLDLRNHGYSFHSPDMSYAHMADDVVALLEHLGVEQAHILGHSMGGKVAAQLALNNPHLVASLILADIAPVPYAPRHQDILAGLNAVDLVNLKSRKQGLEVLNNYESDIKVCQFLIKSLYRTESKEFAWRFNLKTIEEQYQNISAAPQGTAYQGPVLALKGEKSAYILPEHKSAFASLFPHTQLKVMTDCGHWLHAEKPDLFVRLVSRFIRDNESS